MGSRRDQILDLVRDVLGPLVAADGGELYVVAASEDAVELHLAGRFAGCPGNGLATRHIIEPAIRQVAPGARVAVTWGLLIPPGARAASSARG